jgi:hypothetical protein
MRKVRNITVAVDPELYRQTRRLAAEYDTTVTDMVRYLLERFPRALKESRYPGGRPQSGTAAARAAAATPLAPAPPPPAVPPAPLQAATFPVPISNTPPPPGPQIHENHQNPPCTPVKPTQAPDCYQLTPSST